MLNNSPSPTGNQLTDEQHKARASELDRIATRDIFYFLFALKEINDNKYYLHFNDPSMAEYCKRKFDFARSTMFAYLQVANKFLPVFNESGSVQHVGLSTIPLRKLIVLSNLSVSQASDLMKRGEVEIEGRTYTIAVINAMDIDKLRELINGKDDEPEEEEKGIPFYKVYNRAERHFTHILNSVFNCPQILEPDQIKIELHIREAIKIFDNYKQMEDAVKKIK